MINRCTYGSECKWTQMRWKLPIILPVKIEACKVCAQKTYRLSAIIRYSSRRHPFPWTPCISIDVWILISAAQAVICCLGCHITRMPVAPGKNLSATILWRCSKIGNACFTAWYYYCLCDQWKQLQKVISIGWRMWCFDYFLCADCHLVFSFRCDSFEHYFRMRFLFF